jgi:uncharacterized protein YodC (DUF2158 family)
MAIEIGSVVRLKSGGPSMTVVSLHQGHWLCTWFDSKNEPREALFTEALISPVQPGVNFELTEKSPYIDVSKF